MPNIRRIWYRSVYLKSPAWKLTRWLRKRDKCQQCGARGVLHLHHVNYKGYRWFNLLIPDMTSKMQTLCGYHHWKAHKTR